MPIDIMTPDSPGWWLKRCHDKLVARRRRIDPLYARYENKVPLPPQLRDAPETARAFFETSRTGFAELIVKTVRYRLKVAAILTAQDQGEQGDAKAWRAWKSAGMVVEMPDILRNALVAGDGYALVQDHNGTPAATSEDPRQVVTIHDPLRQSVVRAGAKFFHDDDYDMDYAYLYRPGRVWVAQYSKTAKTLPRFSAQWSWSEKHGGAEGMKLPDGFENEVTLVRFRNDEGVGEFERHGDLLNRIEHLILQGMVIATLQAFKQRAIKVDEDDMPQHDPDTGEAIDYDDVFSSDPAALWKLPASAEMWESGAVDVTPITGMVNKQLEQLSAVTFTPLSAFTPEGANQSAQGASLVREGSTFKTEDKQERFGAALQRTASLIFRMGDIDVPEESVQIVWAPAQRYSLTERTAAGVQAKAAGVPWRTVMREVMQFPPEVVERMESERMDDAILFPAETVPDLAPQDV